MVQSYGLFFYCKKVAIKTLQINRQLLQGFLVVSNLIVKLLTIFTLHLRPLRTEMLLWISGLIAMWMLLSLDGEDGHPSRPI